MFDRIANALKKLTGQAPYSCTTDVRLTGRSGPYPDGVFHAVYAGSGFAITGELRVSVFL